MKQLLGAVRDHTGKMWRSVVGFTKECWRRIKKFGRIVTVVVVGVVAVCFSVFFVSAGWCTTNILESALGSVRDWIKVPWDSVQQFLQGRLDDGVIACPVVAIMAFLKRCLEETGEAWSSLKEGFEYADDYIEGNISASRMREAMWNSSFHLALPFIVAGIAGSVAEFAAEKGVSELELKATLSMSEVSLKRPFDKPRQADVLMVVQVQVHALKKENRKRLDDEHGVVCGYVGPNQDAVNDLRATAAMHYGFKTDNPVSTLTMLVEKDTYWRIGHCVESDEQNEQKNPEVKVRAYRLGVDLENLAGKTASVEDAAPAGSG